MSSCLPIMSTAFASSKLSTTFSSASSPINGATKARLVAKVAPCVHLSFAATVSQPSCLKRAVSLKDHNKKGRRSRNKSFFAAAHQNPPSKDQETPTTTTRTNAYTATSPMSAIMTELERDQLSSSKEDLQSNGSSSQHPSSPLASRWRELAGSDDWAGLLDPMDPLLRTELIRYGEMSQACYDAFDYDPSSRYCGTCKYSRARFFQSLDLPNTPGDYSVTRYLYATSNIRLPNFLTRSRYGRLAWTESANWIGYVAVSSDEGSRALGRRDITVAWRGTVTRLEWLENLSVFLRPVAEEGIPCPDRKVMAESGFLDLYTDKDPDCRLCRYSAREQVLAEVGRLVRYYACQRGEQVSVSVTGHSLGSALAKLSAFDIAETMRQNSSSFPAAPAVPVTVYSFSGPRVGNSSFKDRFERDLGVKAIRVVNVHDSVPCVPWRCYTHVGVELRLDHRKSPFLKDTPDPACSHNLEAHLHLLDGYHGTGERFKLATGRDPALVNKASDFLKDHHMVPPFWRQDENKGMVRGEDGRWVQPERQQRVLMDDSHEDHHHHPDHETGRHLKELGLLAA